MKLSVALLIFSASCLLADDPALAPKPVQLQFIAPDSVQEDMKGNVKCVVEKMYRTNNGAKDSCYQTTMDTYNPQGCSLEKSIWDENGNLQRKTVTTYDDKGNIVSRQKLDANNQVISSESLTFDATSRKVIASAKGPEGILQGRTISIYDAYGKEHEVTHFDASGQMSGRTTMARNFQGKEVTITFYDSNNKNESTITVAWNLDGSQSSQSYLDKRGVTTNTQYEYTARDSHGNWTARTETADSEKDDGTSIGGGETISERVITYY